MFCYIESTNGLKRVVVNSLDHAKTILSLLFPQHVAFAVENGIVAFSQNLTIEEAELLSPEPKPVKKTVVKSKVKVKASKKPVKKTTVKSKKVVKKAKPKKKAKKK